MAKKKIFSIPSKPSRKESKLLGINKQVGKKRLIQTLVSEISSYYLEKNEYVRSPLPLQGKLEFV